MESFLFKDNYNIKVLSVLLVLAVSLLFKDNYNNKVPTDLLACLVSLLSKYRSNEDILILLEWTEFLISNYFRR